MTGINLWSKSVDLQKERIFKYKSWVFSVTTVVLIVCLVVLAGGVGWSLYLQSKKGKVSAQIADLQGSIAAKSEIEAAALLVLGRARFIDQVLVERSKGLAKISQDIDPKNPEVGISGWQITPGGQKITVVSTNVGAVEEYADQLTKIFGNVTLEKVSGTLGGVWEASVLGGSL